MNEWTTDRLGEPVAMLAVDSGSGVAGCANGVTGTVKAVFTRKDHAYVTAGTSDMDEPPQLSYRGKSFSVSLHLFAGSGWASDPDDDPNTGPRVYDMKGQDAARTFHAAIVAAVTSAVAAFVAEHPEVPLLAEVNKLETEARRATDEMSKAREAYDAAVVHRARVLTLLQEARNHLAEG